jgi:hypothetical protein
MSVVEQREKSLAEAIAVLVKEIHKSFPTVSTRPLPPSNGTLMCSRTLVGIV